MPPAATTLLEKEASSAPHASSALSQLIPLPARAVLQLDKPVHLHFDEQVARTPTQLAVSDGHEQLTYAELGARAGQIASRLLASGFGRGDVAALLLERTCTSIAAMLGVMKAGGAYLPLDLGAPANRLRAILADSRARVLLSTQQVAQQLLAARLLETLPAPLAASPASPEAPSATPRLLLLDEAAPESPPAPPSSSQPFPRDLAYIIYTSGSTGIPKGSMVEHHSVVNLVEGLHHAILAQHGPALRVAAVAPFVFDPSVQQIFSALLLGHSLFLVPETARRDGRLLAEFFIRHAIDIADGTPAHLKLLARAPRAVGTFLPVKHFIIGGETLRFNDASSFLERFATSQPLITNIYGTAECAVDSCSYTLDRERLEPAGNVPIGTPLVNTQLYVVNEKLELLPRGETGELCIAGEGVGRGYMGDPSMTSTRFVANPFEPGVPMYRTGDLARCRPDGVLEHHGRVDRQMKIRGYRIEPSEIEAKLLAYQPASAPPLRKEAGCLRCLLTTRFPGVTVNSEGICNVCNSFEQHQSQVMRYFDTPAGLDPLFAEARRTRRGAYDCLLLYSGGKDSSYVLYKLVERGLKVLTFTFDNGFISKGAFQNIERVTGQLGVEHITMNTARMKEVFAESLKADKTVCTGCFRALTAISTQLAAERGINVVVTGLSRGQIFDTKLKQFFDSGIFEPGEIEKQLVTHRKMYHARKDAIASLLTADVEPAVIDQIQFVDYFRYDPAGTAEVLEYLTGRDRRWKEPSDTGFCSTNCLINNVGIYVHQQELGFHNYAAPLSWEIRLGLLTRQEGLETVGEHINPQRVRQILRQLQYTPRTASPIIDAAVVKHGEDSLAAYVATEQTLDTERLREHLAEELPEYMVPGRIVPVTSLPLTHNGKLDLEALTRLGGSRQAARAEPKTETERRMHRIWQELFERSDIGLEDDFVRLGGSSLKAALMAALIEAELGLALPPATVFDHPTVRSMAEFVDSLSRRDSGGDADRGVVLLRPGGGTQEHLFLIHDGPEPSRELMEASRQLKKDCHVWAVQADIHPGEEGVRAPLPERARSCIERLRPLNPAPAWRLGGWGFGGVLAYEVAQQLTTAGEQVELVVLVEPALPHAEHWKALQASWTARLRETFPQASLAVAATGDVSEQCQQLLQRIGRYQRGLDRLRQSLPAEVLRALGPRADPSHADFVGAVRRVATMVGVLAGYTPAGQLGAALRLVQGSERHEAERAHWQRLAGGPLQLYVVEGDQPSIISASVTCSLLATLDQALA